MPLPEKGRKVQTKRRSAQKVPSYHLTGDKTMKYIKEANDRVKEKELKDKKTENIKKEAWGCRKGGKTKNETKVKKIVTCLKIVQTKRRSAQKSQVTT